MADLKDVLVHICNEYPPKLSLPMVRLTQVVYLADWRCSIVYGHTLTRAKWFVNELGVYTPDIAAGVKSDPAFSVVRSLRLFRKSLKRVTVRHDAAWKPLSREDKEVLNAVLETSAKRSSTDFLSLIESTFPCLLFRRGVARPIDLMVLAYERKYESGATINRLLPPPVKNGSVANR